MQTTKASFLASSKPAYNVFDEYRYEQQRKARLQLLAENEMRQREEIKLQSRGSIKHFIQQVNSLDNQPGIWQSIAHDLLESVQSNLSRIAEDLGLSVRTLMRLRDGKTQRPHHKTACRLVNLHKNLNPKFYELAE